MTYMNPQAAVSAGNEPAWPVHELNGHGQQELTCVGLTKRELFAAMAMQGYCAVHEGWDEPASEVARCAVDMADALLAALSPEGAK